MAGQPREVSRQAPAPALLAALVASMLAACAPNAPAPPAPPAPPAETAPLAAAEADRILPAATKAWYQQAGARGDAVLRIDPEASLIVATVRRGGALARLGHDHVVASHTVEGLVAPAAGRADFGFRLSDMLVDEAALRAEAKLDTRPSPEAIAGTRTNMLGKVLDAGRYPLVLLQVLGQNPSPAASERNVTTQLTMPVTMPVTIQVTLHGVSRTMPALVQIDQASGVLTASGSLLLRQSDFGITPMSVMGGAMTVADTLELRYRLVARPR